MPAYRDIRDAQESDKKTRKPKLIESLFIDSNYSENQTLNADIQGLSNASNPSKRIDYSHSNSNQLTSVAKTNPNFSYLPKNDKIQYNLNSLTYDEKINKRDLSNLRIRINKKKIKQHKSSPNCLSPINKFGDNKLLIRQYLILPKKIKSNRYMSKSKKSEVIMHKKGDDTNEKTKDYSSLGLLFNESRSIYNKLIIDTTKELEDNNNLQASNQIKRSSRPRVLSIKNNELNLKQKSILSTVNDTAKIQITLPKIRQKASSTFSLDPTIGESEYCADSSMHLFKQPGSPDQLETDIKTHNKSYISIAKEERQMLINSSFGQKKTEKIILDSGFQTKNNESFDVNKASKLKELRKGYISKVNKMRQDEDRSDDKKDFKKRFQKLMNELSIHDELEECENLLNFSNATEPKIDTSNKKRFSNTWIRNALGRLVAKCADTDLESGDKKDL